MEFPIVLAVLALLVLLAGLIISLGGRRGSARVQTRRHGELEGRPVALHTLGNALGLTAQVSEFGATLVSVRVPDRQGVIAEVTLGHDDFRGYVEQNPYLGSTVGRYANRIADGRFTWTADRADDWRKPPGDHVTTRYQEKRLGDCAPVFLDFVRR